MEAHRVFSAQPKIRARTEFLNPTPDRALLAGDGLLPRPHAKLAGRIFEE